MPVTSQPTQTYPQTVNPDTHYQESRFRETVREILDLDPFTRDQKIFDELRRLKQLDRC